MSSQYHNQAPVYAGIEPGGAPPQNFAQQAPIAPHAPISGYVPSDMAPGAAWPATAGMIHAPGTATATLPAVYQAQPTQPFSSLPSDRFLRGLLIGAAATYILTNEDVQRTVIKGAVKIWTTLQGGIEEAKERFRDAEAELHAGADNDA